MGCSWRPIGDIVDSEVPDALSFDQHHVNECGLVLREDPNTVKELNDFMSFFDASHCKEPKESFFMVSSLRISKSITARVSWHTLFIGSK
jgi:hypothetical protein